MKKKEEVQAAELVEEPKQECVESALVVHDDESVPRLVVSLDAMRQFHDEKMRFIKDVMVDGHDYGVIPGCGSKPSLLKPGAEKLLQVYGFGSLMDKTGEDATEKRYEVTYKCSITHKKSGKVVAQCEGTACSEEKRNWSTAPLKLKNTIQKIAQKRAFVGATLFATGCSDVFTQDVEDMEPTQAPTPRAEPVPPEVLALQGLIIEDAQSFNVPVDVMKPIIFAATGDPKLKLRNVMDIEQLKKIQSAVADWVSTQTTEETKGA